MQDLYHQPYFGVGGLLRLDQALIVDGVLLTCFGCYFNPYFRRLKGFSHLWESRPRLDGVSVAGVTSLVIAT